MFTTVSEILQQFKISPNSDEHRYNDATIINIFNGQIENYVEHDKYHYLIGLYYQYVDTNYEMAIKFYDSTLKCEPDNESEMFFLIGACYYNLGDEEKAKFWMEKAEEEGNEKATKFLNKHFYDEEEEDIYGFSKLYKYTDEILGYLSIPSNYIPPPQLSS